MPNAVTVAGGNGPGSGANQLNYPDRIFVDANGAVYIPDINNNRIVKWLPGATTGITVAGGNGVGSGSNQFNKPTSVFVDEQGNVFVTDQNNSRVQKWAPGATQGVTVIGASGALSLPTDIFIDKSGNMYVSDQGNNLVKKFPPGSGTFTIVTSPGELNAPTGIYVDENGNLYVCDTNNSRVVKFAAGIIFGVTIANYTSLTNPLDVAVDCAGNAYVADYGNNRIQRYTPGSLTGITVAGGNGQGFAANQLYNPISVFLAERYIYVTDYVNHRIQRFTITIDTTFIPNGPGNYSVNVSYPCCPDVNANFQVIESQQPDITIRASATGICGGTNTTFSADNSNHILEPVYQWKLNGADVGTNADTYSSTLLKDGDQLQCILTSTRACTLPSSDTSNMVQMKVFTPVPLNLGPDIVICPGTDTLLESPDIYVSYRWQDNSDQPALMVNNEGKYYLTVQDKCNNTFTDTVMVSFFKPAKNFLPRDTTFCNTDPFTILLTKSFSSYLWSDQSTGISLTVSQPGTYWLQVTDQNNCLARDSIALQTKTCPPHGLYVPNAFTPGSRTNGVFRPIVYGQVKHYRFEVFNRYGQLVFSSSVPLRGWDGTVNGKPAGTGAYAWYCKYEVDDQGLKTVKGTVVLVR